MAHSERRTTPIAVTPVFVTPIVITEQASHRIVVLDAERDWASDTAVMWSWSPGTERGVAVPNGSWGLPDDARLRRDPSTGQQYLMVCDSYGLLAAVLYPQGGRAAWSVDVGRAANPHGIERLPDGNVAAAASTAGWVRLYATGQALRSDRYVEDSLPGAHEVLWDDAERVLWAVGDDHLVEYAVGGTSAFPTLERRATYDLPSAGGHDLQPIPGRPRSLWVTTVAGIHRFDISARAFAPVAHPCAPDLERSNVKSIGTDARSGVVMQTTPKAGNPSTWCTDQVDLFCQDGEPVSKILRGAQIYRARWFDESST